MAYEFSHLPISKELERTFPEIHATCFIISQFQEDLTIHEKDSKKELNSMTFEKFIARYDEIRPKGKSNLRDMIKTFESALTSNKELYDDLEEFSGLKLYRIESDGSNAGCCFYYKNPNGIIFIGIIYGLSIEELISDVLKIKAWLDQFFEVNASNKNSKEIKIPILYGCQHEINLGAISHKILMSNKLPKKIEKIIRYRTIVRAPVNIGDDLGVVFYCIDLFQNPIVKVIRSKREIKQATWFKCIYDSFLYLIFGPTTHVKKGS